jgi:hypothetical protein
MGKDGTSCFSELGAHLFRRPTPVRPDGRALRDISSIASPTVWRPMACALTESGVSTVSRLTLAFGDHHLEGVSTARHKRLYWIIALGSGA